MLGASLAPMQYPTPARLRRASSHCSRGDVAGSTSTPSGVARRAVTSLTRPPSQVRGSVQPARSEGRHR